MIEHEVCPKGRSCDDECCLLDHNPKAPKCSECGYSLTCMNLSCDLVDEVQPDWSGLQAPLVEMRERNRELRRENHYMRGLRESLERWAVQKLEKNTDDPFGRGVQQAARVVQALMSDIDKIEDGRE